MKRLANLVKDILWLLKLLLVDLPRDFIKLKIYSRLKWARKYRKAERWVQARKEILTEWSSGWLYTINRWCRNWKKPLRQQFNNFIQNTERWAETTKEISTKLFNDLTQLKTGGKYEANRKHNLLQVEYNTSGEARIVKRVYKPSYIEVTPFLRREVYHEEEHYICIELEGKRYKLRGKEIFRRFEDVDTIPVERKVEQGERGIGRSVSINILEPKNEPVAEPTAA